MLSDREILELAERARGGEREALGRLASALRPLVCRWALVMTGDPDDAEDVAQLVMMKMMASIGGFDGRSKVTSWLYTCQRIRPRSLRLRYRVRRPPGGGPGEEGVEGQTGGP